MSSSGCLSPPAPCSTASNLRGGIEVHLRALVIRRSTWRALKATLGCRLRGPFANCNRILARQCATPQARAPGRARRAYSSRPHGAAFNTSVGTLTPLRPWSRFWTRLSSNVSGSGPSCHACAYPCLVAANRIISRAADARAEWWPGPSEIPGARSSRRAGTHWLASLARPDLPPSTN